MLMVLVIGITVLAHYQPFQETLSQSVQVLGLFTVVATATGCLYFLDQDNIASSVGLNATGVLLLILNFGFVLLMAVLILLRGGPTVLNWARCVQEHSAQWLRFITGMSHWPRANPAVVAAGSFGSSRSFLLQFSWVS